MGRSRLWRCISPLTARTGPREDVGEQLAVLPQILRAEGGGAPPAGSSPVEPAEGDPQAPLSRPPVALPDDRLYPAPPEFVNRPALAHLSPFPRSTAEGSRDWAIGTTQRLRRKFRYRRS